MSAEKDLVRLERAKGGVPYREIKAALNAYGFQEKRTNHTLIWKHELLKGSGPFDTGRFQVGDHFDGKSGQSSSKNAHDAALAIRCVIDKMREIKEQEDKE